MHGNFLELLQNSSGILMKNEKKKEELAGGDSLEVYTGSNMGTPRCTRNANAKVLSKHSKSNKNPRQEQESYLGHAGQLLFYVLSLNFCSLNSTSGHLRCTPSTSISGFCNS